MEMSLGDTGPHLGHWGCPGDCTVSTDRGAVKVHSPVPLCLGGIHTWWKLSPSFPSGRGFSAHLGLLVQSPSSGYLSAIASLPLGFAAGTPNPAEQSRENAQKCPHSTDGLKNPGGLSPV